MESANWDLEAAMRVIHPHAVFAKPNHKSFAFESFVFLTLFEGFDYPKFTVHLEKTFTAIAKSSTSINSKRPKL
ncbi:protein GRAVITROPIC IN THE LIGHT 1 [Senna tora]|uniref:Protein GRAVITROPIC IN THE LIGHT 1 n=1 Tax=Senna tora TaxID=362788 RepID=A0A834W080_9FABA|nr:protein GRAVITROPIC IN THE LIGHT 1 [Senna tora]